MGLTINSQQLVEEANKTIRTLSLDEARELLDDNDTLFVDIRDIRELQRSGTIPGAFHAPRGMLEFWVDPDSPYFKPELGSGKTLVFYCQSAWRSALATAAVARMGLEPVCHLEGGFAAWTAANLPVTEVTDS